MEIAKKFVDICKKLATDLMLASKDHNKIQSNGSLISSEGLSHLKMQQDKKPFKVSSPTGSFPVPPTPRETSKLSDPNMAIHSDLVRLLCTFYAEGFEAFLWSDAVTL